MTTRLHGTAVRAAIGAAALVSLALPAQADAVADFYKGNTIRVSVGGSAAGGFTLNARVLSETMKKYIPGKPTILVEPKPGAGGAKSMDYILNAVPQDGTHIGAVLPPAITAPLLRKLRYDGSKAIWLGSITGMSEVLSVWHTSPAKTVEEAKKTSIVMATSSKLSSAYLLPAFLNAVAGTKFTMVQGYRGGGPMNKAMQTGEANGRGSFYNSYKITKPHWLRDKQIFHLIQVGPPISDIPEVPNLSTFARNDDERQIVKFLEVSARIGHGFYVGQNVPKDRVAALQKAFVMTMKDPEFLASAKQRNMIVAPIAAADMQAAVAAAYATPKPLLAKFKKMVKLGKGKKKK